MKAIFVYSISDLLAASLIAFFVIWFCVSTIKDFISKKK